MAKVNVGLFEPSTCAMGPGIRACVWVRGCSLNCAGCISQEFISHQPETLVDVCEMEWWIKRAQEQHGIEGVSFSGGEPFGQAEALALVAKFAHELNLSTLAWSGYTRAFLESKRAPKGSKEFLANLDVLIDGPFIRTRAEGAKVLRGSTNQVLHLLTDRYALKDFERAMLEAKITSQGELTVHGVTDYEGLQAVLAQMGLR